MRALILESGLSRGALAAARSLGRAGWSVGVGSPGGGLAGRSRYARHHQVPAPESDADGFVRAVQIAVASDGYDVVFGAGDAEVITLSKHRDRIAAAVPYPPHDDLVRALDKATLAEAASDAGLDVPGSAAEPPDDWDAYVVKARMHLIPRSEATLDRFEAEVFTDAGSARARMNEIRDGGGVPIVQEWVDGELVAYSVLVGSDGIPVMRCLQLAEHVYPVSAGVSSRARTLPVEDVIAQRVEALLRALRWVGIAEVQFIRSADGRDVLIDLNGRFYGSIGLAIAAGADLPLGWAQDALGRPTGASDARPGVRYQWLEGDLRRAWRSRARIGDTVDALRYARGATHSIMARDDMRPALWHLGQLARRGVRKVIR